MHQGKAGIAFLVEAKYCLFRYGWADQTERSATLNQVQLSKGQQAIAIGIVVLFFAIGGIVSVIMQQQQTKELKSAPLAEIYKTYKTELIKEGPADPKYDNSYPSDTKPVTYMSDGAKLMGWLAIPEQPGAGGGKGAKGKKAKTAAAKAAAKTGGKSAKPAPTMKTLKRPAVVYLHGGTSLGAGDFDDAARKFYESGFIVFMPSMRGENGNPGSSEMCFGEVKDAMAAVEYVSKLPEVDKNLIFVAGHSIGGTNAMLLAEVCPGIRKVAACGGYPNMYHTGPYPDAPFKDETKERFYRSPQQFVSELKCPLLLLYGGDDKGDVMYAEQAEEMRREGLKELKKITVETIPHKDHFTALSPAIDSMIEFFRSN